MKEERKIKLNSRSMALISLPFLVALSILYFPVGMAIFLFGNVLIVLSVINIRLKIHGAASLIDPVLGMKHKLSFSKHPMIFFGVILSGSFMISLALKFFYMVIAS